MLYHLNQIPATLNQTRTITFTFHQAIQWLLAAVLVIAALGFRFNALGHESFWIDEIGHYEAAKRSTFMETLEQVRGHRGAAPLDYILLRGFYLLTGAETEAAIRVPYAIYGALAVLMLFVLIKDVYGTVAGLSGAAVLATMPIHLEYSQEVRFYSLAVLLALLSTWLFLRAAKGSSWSAWLLWGISSLAGLYTAYGMAFVLAAQGVYLLILVAADRRKWRSHMLPAAVVGVAVVALFAPWLWWDSVYDSFDNGQSVTTAEMAWAGLTTSNYSLRWVQIMLGATVIGALLRQEGWLWLSIVAAVFFGAIAINNVSGYFFHNRQLLLMWPFLVSGMVGAPVALAKRFGYPQVGSILAIALCAQLLSQTVPGLSVYYASYSKPNWNGALTTLRDSLQDNDLVLVLARNDYREARYYVAKANPTARVVPYTIGMELPEDGNVWAVGTHRRQNTVPAEMLLDLAKYGFAKVGIGTIYMSELNTKVQKMTPIDPASLPPHVALEEATLVVNGGWGVRRDSLETSVVEGTTLSLIVKPELRARAVFVWPGPLDLSEHHKGVLRAAVSPGCAVSLETASEESGVERPVSSWAPGELSEVEFPVSGDHLKVLYLLLDAIDPSVTECTAKVENVSFFLDDRFSQ